MDIVVGGSTTEASGSTTIHNANASASLEVIIAGVALCLAVLIIVGIIAVVVIIRRRRLKNASRHVNIEEDYNASLSSVYKTSPYIMANDDLDRKSDHVHIVTADVEIQGIHGKEYESLSALFEKDEIDQPETTETISSPSDISETQNTLTGDQSKIPTSELKAHETKGNINLIDNEQKPPLPIVNKHIQLVKTDYKAKPINGAIKQDIKQEKGTDSGKSGEEEVKLHGPIVNKRLQLVKCDYKLQPANKAPTVSQQDEIHSMPNLSTLKYQQNKAANKEGHFSLQNKLIGGPADEKSQSMYDVQAHRSRTSQRQSYKKPLYLKSVGDEIMHSPHKSMSKTSITSSASSKSTRSSRSYIEDKKTRIKYSALLML